jgi:hypothetical protein
MSAMLTTSLKHYWLAVTAIAFTGLLSTTSVNANPVTYTVGGAHATLSVRFTTEPTASETGTFQSFSAGTYVIRLSDLPSTRRDFQGAALTSFVEDLHLTSSTGHEADTPNIFESRAALTHPDPNKLTLRGVILLLRRLFIVLAPLRKAITLLAEVVPTPTALILLGSGLLGLVFGIRRITTRNES